MATVPCPTCRAAVEWSEASPFRPFCSERCRLIDLGEWMAGRHAIPGEPLEDAGLMDTDLTDASDGAPRH
ncbi:MAG: DNA gyrase inhibitor YacG [Steroidobacteraceae bacterium]